MNTTSIRPFAAAKLLTFAALALLGGCHVSGIQGNGNVVTEQRSISDFADLEASGAFRIEWASGPASVRIITDQNLLQFIDTNVAGNKLRIRSHQTLHPTEHIKVKVTSPSLSGVRLDGAVRFDADHVTGKGFYLDASGATRVTVDGKVDELLADMSGASRLDANSLQTRTTKLSISGAGRAEVNASEALEVSISGAGKVIYSGNPKTVKRDVNGAGSIKPRDS